MGKMIICKNYVITFIIAFLGLIDELVVSLGGIFQVDKMVAVFINKMCRSKFIIFTKSS